MNNKSLDQLILDFLDYMEVEKSASRLTIRNYHHYLKRFAEWFHKEDSDKKIEELDLNTLRGYRLYLSRYKDEYNGNLAKVTQSYHVIAIRSFLKWLTKNDVEVLAPEKIDLPKTESRSLSFLNRKQVESLLNSPNVDEEAGLRDRTILEVLFSTGLRVSELVKLNRDKINFETREFGIIGKGGRARVVFLSDRAAGWLRRYFQEREDDWQPAFIRYAKNKTPRLPKGEDMRLTARSVQRIVKKYRRLAKLPVEITPHGLRHSFATDLLQQGAGLREVQEMLGHKNVATTQVYTHVTNPQLKKVHDRFHSGNKNS